MNTESHEIIQAKINQLDLDPIKFKLAHEYKYKAAQLDTLEKWYKRFLFLTFIHPGRSVVICQAIDKFWHQHILDTAKYAEDCENTFGVFLHHFPYFGLRGEDDYKALQQAYRETIQLMIEEFGESPEDDLKAALGPEGTIQSEAASSCSDCDHIWPDISSAIDTNRPRFHSIMG